jgi:hypothetical protein
VPLCTADLAGFFVAQPLATQKALLPPILARQRGTPQPNLQNSDFGRTAARHAIWQGKHDTLTLLLKKCTFDPIHLTDAMWAAVDAVRLLLRYIDPVRRFAFCERP